MNAQLHVPEFSTSVALIVGGTSGVGLATASAFARAGVRKIGLIGRSEERGAKAKAAVLKHASDARVAFFAADANDPTRAEAAVRQVTETLGAIDILVNSTVGSALPDLFHNIPIARIATDLADQVLGPLVMCGAVLPGMRQRKGGVIINIASDAAKAPTPGESVIGAAMAAIVMFSRTLAMEAKRDGIRVNAITPSLIEGTMTYDRLFEHEFSAKLFQKAAKAADLGVVNSDDLASLAVFLTSPQAARITGQAISVNGGISAA
jgi:NAD(P)-dependent dehydrogenase (short-subunit alcohol dehydrogenase family)